jgi:tripeptide aminopeptidase
MSSVVERFLKYVRMDTTSNDENPLCPSSPGQKILAELLVKELADMGVDARSDANAYVYASIPATVSNAPAIGLIAHMDTVDAVPGRNFSPRVLTYSGGDIVLNADLQIVMRASEFDSLSEFVGRQLIVTDGTSVLGADDKAGVAEIMAAAEIISRDTDIPHGRICICFTPDEEIGRGADLFDVPGFGADFAYTVDGGALNEIEYENFNAASAAVAVHGRSIHPGSAKNRMINAARLAMEFHGMLSPNEVPEHTQGYEGFIHLMHMEGREENASLSYILRDHDLAKLDQKKVQLAAIADYLNAKYGEGAFKLTIKDSYRNMREMILPQMHIIRRAEDALRNSGITPVCVPIRGGTDGARLSFIGLPCPNIATGGYNGHGIYEYIPVASLEKMVEVLVNIIRV